MIIYPLRFGAATSDRVVITDSLTVQNITPWYFFAVLKVTVLTTGRRIYHKNTAGASNNVINLNGTGGNLACLIGFTGTDASYITNDTPFATLSIPYIVLVVSNPAGGAGKTVHIYTSKWGQPLRESSYGTSIDGTGTPEADATNGIRIGNNPANTLSWQGSMWSFAYGRGVLTPADYGPYQIYPRATSAVKSRLGMNGTGTVKDESGNGNHGIITGAIPTNDVLPNARMGYGI